MKLSVAIITKNEEKRIEKTLKAVKELADEIVIVDSNSTDKTLDIAKKYNAKIYIEDWKGFGKQKNSALEKCSGEWILMLDADEEVSSELADEIKNIIKNNEYNAYEIKRVAWYFGQKTRTKDKVIRLVKKGVGKYDAKEVHENFETSEKVGELRGIINHYTYESIEDYFVKFNKYTTLAALEMEKNGKKASIRKMMLNPFSEFTKKYFIKLGILDGIAGLSFALFSGMYVFVKYAKFFYLKKNKPNIIISRTDKIGDLVLSLPSFKKIRDMYPESNITILVRNYNYDIVKNLPYVDNIIKVDEYTEEELERKIKELRADIFIALFTNKQIVKLARKSGAKLRIGAYSKLSSFFSYNKGIIQKRSNCEKNEAEYNLDLVRKVNKEKYDAAGNVESKIYLAAENINNSQKFFKENNIDKKRKTVIIHPFSAGSAKNLSENQYKNLVEKLVELNCNVIITGSKNESEKMEFYKKNFGNKIYYFINEGSIMDLAAVIDNADVFIGSSTGPTHIAGVLGKKVIAVFSKIKVQSVKRWGMYSCKDINYVIPNAECNKKYSCSEKCSAYNCFDKIDINEIVDIVQRGM